MDTRSSRAEAPVIPSTSPKALPIWSMSPATLPSATVAARAPVSL